MERQLFTWKGWNQQDTMCFSFDDCIVSKAFGPHQPGDKLRCIVVDYENGVIETYAARARKPTWSGKLRLEVVA